MKHSEHYARQNAVQSAIQIHGGTTNDPTVIMQTAKTILDFVGIPDEPEYGSALGETAQGAETTAKYARDL